MNHLVIQASLGLILLVSVLTTLACGPAAPSGQSGGGGNPEQTETKELGQNPGETRTEAAPTDKPDQTGTQAEPTDKPGETKTESVPAVKREPTKVRTAPPPSEVVDDPTPIPTAVLEAVPANPVIKTGYCYDYSSQDPSTDVKQALEDGLYQNCLPSLRADIEAACDLRDQDDDSIGDASRQTCWKNYLGGIKDYQLRRLLGEGCVAVGHTTIEEYATCLGDLSRQDAVDWANIGPTVGLELMTAIDSDPAVVAAEENAWLCLSEQGKKEPGPELLDYLGDDRLMFWLSWRLDKNAAQKYYDLDSTRKEKVAERMKQVDQCARKAGVYQAHYDSMMLFLRELLKTDPDRLEYWKRTGWLDALEEYGADMIRPTFRD